MPKFYLFLLFLSWGCKSKHIDITTTESRTPPDHYFSLSGESNASEVPFFQSIIKINGLDSLVNRALLKNPDWKVQLAKVELIRVKSGLPTADSQPKLNAQLGFKEGKENTRESGFVEESIPNWQTGALFDWEIDLWGKWKLLKKSSILHIQEAEYLREGSKLTFIHEIARFWLLICALNEDMQILEEATASQEKSLVFYGQRVQAGLDNNITYARQKIALQQIKLEQSKVFRQFETAKIRLCSLLGNPLQAQLPEIINLSDMEIPSLPEVFPTRALKNLPHLKAKEAKLKESLLLEKSSQYDLYPSLSFRASGISISSDLSNPFRQWKASFGPVLNLPIWSPSKKIARKVAFSQAELYKNEWNASINLAIEEIELATKSFIMSQNEHSIASNASKEISKVYATTLERLQAGLISQLELLEDERQYLSIQRDELSKRLQVFQFALNLSKSLGLRWEE
jgi:multidrug efflux system outer membrane protein